MTSAVATTVGCGGLPVRPSSATPRGRPRGRWVVRAQAAGADASDDKSLEIMRKFSEQYARRSNTFFCADKTVTAVVIKPPMQPELEAKLMSSITDGQGECTAEPGRRERDLKMRWQDGDRSATEIYEAAVAKLELAKAAEQDVRMRLGLVTEETDKSSRRAARASEQLDAAQATSGEMEAELRRLRVQSDQGRKARLLQPLYPA